jgi:hypothetical protein
VSAGGEISSSKDNGVTWSALITNPFGGVDIFSISYNFGVFQAGAAIGLTARSYDNGLTWGSLVTNPFGANAITSIASSTSNMVAVGAAGSIATAGWNPAYSLVVPVAAEPSLGTCHFHRYRWWNSLAAAVQTYDIDLSGQVPSGATQISMWMQYVPTAVIGGEAFALDADGGRGIQGPEAGVLGIPVTAQGLVTLTAARHISIQIYSQAVTIYAEMNRYWI